MKNWVAILIAALLPVAGLAADDGFTDAEDRGFPADYHEVTREPQNEDEIVKYAEDGQAGAQQNFGRQPVHDNEIFAVFMADRMEYRVNSGKNSILWDVTGRIGSDYNKLYLESEGAWLVAESEVEEAELELLYGRTIASFWDLRLGIRHDLRPDPDRTFAALGVKGLAPQWFEVEATAWLSEDGDLSAALEVEYDLLLTQKLILQPRLETSAAAHEVEKYGVGSGINDVELGLRLRYEIRREFAPYIGVSWHRKVGNTADLARDEGEDIDVTSFVAGIKFWF